MNFEIAPKDTDVVLTWDDAVLYCECLYINGYSDWRLPNYKELEEIFESANDFQKDWHWSSTTPYVSNMAWLHDFSNGDSTYNFKSTTISFVRAVRTIK